MTTSGLPYPASRGFGGRFVCRGRHILVPGRAPVARRRRCDGGRSCIRFVARNLQISAVELVLPYLRVRHVRWRMRGAGRSGSVTEERQNMRFQAMRWLAVGALTAALSTVLAPSA